VALPVSELVVEEVMRIQYQTIILSSQVNYVFAYILCRYFDWSSIKANFHVQNVMSNKIAVADWAGA
jgi:hypothetical protein